MYFSLNQQVFLKLNDYNGHRRVVFGQTNTSQYEKKCVKPKPFGALRL